MNDKYFSACPNLPARDIIIVLSTSKGNELPIRIPLCEPNHGVSQ